MANRTLSDLPVASTPASADIVHIRQSLTDKSLTLSKVAEFTQNGSDYSPTVVNVTGTTHSISTTIRYQYIICSISSNCTMTFPGSYGDAKEITIKNDVASTANVIGLPNSEVLYPDQEITFIWNGSAFIKREFNTRFFESTAAPTITPNYAGQVFVDNTNNRVWMSTGSSTSADWTELQNKVLNIKTNTTTYTIQDTNGYDLYQATHSTTTGQIIFNLPTLADNIGKIYPFRNGGTYAGLTKIVSEEGSNIIFNNNHKTLSYNYICDMNDSIIYLATSSGWLIISYDCSIDIGNQNRSDWTNAHGGNGVTYDNGSGTSTKASDWTGQKISGNDGSGTNSAIIIEDTGGSGTTGIFYFYYISGSLGYFSNNAVLTAGNGETIDVNEGGGSSKNIDYNLVHDLGLAKEYIETKVDISTDKTVANTTELDVSNYDISLNAGIGKQGVSSNAFIIQYGSTGFGWIDSAGLVQVIDIEDYYEKKLLTIKR